MRKILNKLSILFIVFILIASPQAICDEKTTYNHL